MKLQAIAGLGLASAAAVAALACGNDVGPSVGEPTGTQALANTNPPQVPTPLVGANQFELGSGSLRVSYNPLAEGGSSLFVYQDDQQSHVFRGSDIHVTATDAGTLVSVVLFRTIDSGYATFSVLVPRVEVGSGFAAPIQTQGITVFHQFSVNPTLDPGQRDQFRFTPLEGTASHVGALPAAAATATVSRR